MTPQQIVALCIRIASIYFAISSLHYLVAVPISMASANLSEQLHVSYLTGGIFLLVATVLWFFPMAIAHQILPRSRFDNLLNLQALEAARVGCSLIGLWFAVSTLPKFVWFLFSHLVNSAGQPLIASLTSANRAELIFYLLELIFALFLIFGSRVFAQVVIGKQSKENDTQ